VLYNDSEELEELEREEEITPEELGPTTTKALNELELKKAYGIGNIAAELLQELDKETKHTLYFPISRPTDTTCDRFLFSIYMCITLHVSSIKRSSSGVPHHTYSL
jgi:hypothetical protein